jgi:peptidoglycan/LPS O-acetylase OafA/YrhL
MSQKLERIKALDGLRGLAALSVVVLHLTSPKLQPHLRSESVPSNWWHFSYGHYAVELFFILSGFLVLISLDRKKSLKDFLLSKFTRLYPTYWICLLFSTLIVLTIYPGDKQVTLDTFLANLTMLPKQFLGNDSFIEGQWWTLEYEIYFYLLSGIIFFRLGQRYLISFLLLSSLLGSSFYLFDLFPLVRSLPSILPSVIMRLYGYFLLEYSHVFLVGVLFYYFLNTRKRIYLLMLSVPVFCAFASSIEHGLFVSSLCTLFYFSLTSVFGSLISAPPFLLLGFISYPFYLIHLNLGYSIISLTNVYLSQPIHISIFLGILTVFFFCGSYHLLD